MKYKVIVTRNIIKGFVEETHIVSADDKEMAQTMVEKEPCDYCVNSDTSIAMSEQINIEVEEL